MASSKDNIKAKVTYDGTSYLGFQKTGQGLGVEDFLQSAIEKVLNTKIKLQGASRTDQGVHARHQVINFFLTKPFPLEKLQKALNSNLPKSIRITKLSKASQDFHPTLSAHSKTYRYTIDNASIHSPFRKNTAWYIHTPLDMEKMKLAAKSLIGKHNFTAFATKGHHEQTIRHIDSIEIDKTGDLITITVKGKSFLYRMVRTIVGTLVYIGKGKLKVEECKEILLSLDRKRAGPSAPAHGLSLYHIDY